MIKKQATTLMPRGWGLEWNKCAVREEVNINSVFRVCGSPIVILANRPTDILLHGFSLLLLALKQAGRLGIAQHSFPVMRKLAPPVRTCPSPYTALIHSSSSPMYTF